MKIVFATGIFPPDIGGPATYVERLAKEFRRQDIGVKVITYSSARGNEYEFSVTRIPRKYFSGLRHFIYFWKLFKMVKGCDIIYAQNVSSAGLPSFLVSKLLRKRMVLKIVGDAAWEQHKPYLKVIQKIVANGADNIIVPSHYLKNRIIGWGVSDEKIEVVYNTPEPVVAEEISKEEAKEKTNLQGDIILSVGRLVPWKGFSDLIEIMPDLLKENKNFRLVIVGEGGEKKHLDLKIKKLKLEDSVKLVGSVPHPQMPFYFKAAEMFVLNSGYEGMSHVILESMQLGIPVIASSEGGNPELIEDNFNGFLIEYKNQEQLKVAVLKLWRNKEVQEKFSQNSLIKLKGFIWENLVNKTLNILIK